MVFVAEVATVPVTGSFPVAERLAGQTLSLPMYPELTPEQIGVVTGAIRKFFASGRRR